MPFTIAIGANVMSQAAATDPQNVVKVVDAGPSRKKLQIEIPAAAVAEKLKLSMDTLAVEAALPGFRKGRVPRQLVEKRFGSTVRKEAKNELVASAYSKAIEDLKLQVLGDPTAGNIGEVELADGKPFAFEVEVEVLPEFELPKLEGIKVKKPVLSVTDEIVAEEITKMQINEGSLESRDKAEPGDYLTGHAMMTGPDGKEYYNLKGAVVQSPLPEKKGKGMILGIIVDDFAKQLGNPKASDTVTITCKGPEHHEVEGLRNVDLTVKFTIDRVDRIIPAPVETIQGLFGVESEERLKDLVRTRMQQRVEIQQQSVLHQQIAKYLADETKMELPPRLTAQQALRTLDRQRMELMYRGMEPHQIEERMAELRAVSGASAARDLKLTFILHKAAESLNVRVDEGELNGRIASMAMQRNERPEKLRQELIQTNRVGAVFQQIRDHKTLDAILANASVEEVSAEEFDKAMKAESKKG